MPWRTHHLSRRRALTAAGAAGLTGLLAACAAASPTLTPAPPKPTDVAKPAAAPPTATTAPAPAPPTNPAEPTKAAAPASKPAEAAKPATAVPGGQAAVEMWVRSGGAERAMKALADSWNSGHPNATVKLTPIPGDQFVAKFAAAAGARQMPDLASVDLIYMPGFVRNGLFTDLTGRIKDLPYATKLLPAHVNQGERAGRLHAVPGVVDISSLFYNKALYRQAGLDPEKPPTTWGEIEQHAERISKLGSGVAGFYFSGNCGGCFAFTLLPLIWASGGDVLSADGQTARLDSAEPKAALEFYKRLWDKKYVPAAAQTDTGANFVSTFADGKIGIQPLGSFAVPLYKAQYPNLDFGVAPLPGESGNKSSFAGGDVVGIPMGPRNPEPAWEFVKYYLSDEVQVEVVAKSGALTVRSDLASNKYSQKDPRVLVNNQLLDVAKAPKTTVFFELFNDANGPWLAAIRGSIFGGDVAGSLSKGQQQFQQIIASAR